VKLMFVEPPKGFRPIMRQYVPLPFGLHCLATYLEERYTEAEVEVVGSQAEGLDWQGLENRVSEPMPDVMAPSGMATSNAFCGVRDVELAKRVNPSVGAEYIGYAEKTPFLFPCPGSLIRALSSSLNGRGAQLLFISISLAGLMILARLPFIDGVPQISIPFQKEVTGTLFIAVYALGLVAAVSPRSLRGLGHGSSSSRMVGHHPDCGRFRGHVVWFNGRLLCAGCSGLALGALMGIIGSVLYFFLGSHLFMPDVIFWLGVVSVALGLIQHFIDLDNPHVHLLLNVALVCGSFMLASSLDAMGASFYVEAYLLGLVVFWVAARIRVSQEEHILVCSACSEKCDRGFRAIH
jgi:hypothetical protein